MSALRVFAISAVLAMILVIAYTLLADERGGTVIDVTVLNDTPVSVSIAGAVASPGVYTLPANARLNDLILAAGGLTGHAVTTGLNLAARVGDGEQVVIPSRQPATSASATATPGNGLVNINTASAAELDELPGIGPVLAARIVEYRTLHGPFTTIDQLVEVEGISRNTVDDLRDLVTLGG